MSALLKAGFDILATTAVGSLAGKLFGGGSSENIARGFSKRHGLSCAILDRDKGQAAAMIAKGIDPCTGRAKNPVQTVTVPNIPGAGATPPIRPTNGDPDLYPFIPDSAYTVPPDFGPVQPRMNVTRRTAPVSAITERAGTYLSGAIAGVFRTQTGRISSVVMPSGKRFSRKNAVAFLKRVGDIATGAALMGISQQEAAEMVLTQAPRRRRGITAAQVRNARRTACMVSRLARDLGVKPAPARRRSTCR